MMTCTSFLGGNSKLARVDGYGRLFNTQDSPCILIRSNSPKRPIFSRVSVHSTSNPKFDASLWNSSIKMSLAASSWPSLFKYFALAWLDVESPEHIAKCFKLTAKVVGWRVLFCSWYRNVIEIEKVGQQRDCHSLERGNVQIVTEHP